MPFDAGTGDDDHGKLVQCCYVVIEKETQDPTVLLSNGEILWRLYEQKDHPVLEDQEFLCNDCLEKIEEEKEDDDDQP